MAKNKPSSEGADTAEPQDVKTEDPVNQTGGTPIADVCDPVEQKDMSEAGETPEPSSQEEPEQNQEVDQEAPYGRRADGTPAAKRGPKTSAGASDERNKQRARLKSVSPGKALPKKIPAIESPTPLAVVNYQAMGEMVAGVWFNGGIMLLGEEWAPDIKAGEHLAVAGAFRDYFKAMNYKDLPPGFALVAVLSLYTLKRAPAPGIKTKLQRVGLWLKTNVRLRK